MNDAKKEFENLVSILLKSTEEKDEASIGNLQALLKLVKGLNTKKAHALALNFIHLLPQFSVSHVKSSVNSEEFIGGFLSMLSFLWGSRAGLLLEIYLQKFLSLFTTSDLLSLMKKFQTFNHFFSVAPQFITGKWNNFSNSINFLSPNISSLFDFFSKCTFVTEQMYIICNYLPGFLSKLLKPIKAEGIDKNHIEYIFSFIDCLASTDEISITLPSPANTQNNDSSKENIAKSMKYSSFLNEYHHLNKKEIERSVIICLQFILANVEDEISSDFEIMKVIDDVLNKIDSYYCSQDCQEIIALVSHIRQIVGLNPNNHRLEADFSLSFSFKELFSIKHEIQAGNKFSFLIDVWTPDSLIYWSFNVSNFDINVQISYFGYFDEIESDENNVMKLIKMETKPSDPKRGVHLARKIGIYKVTFDNGYSWFNEKKIICRVHLLDNLNNIPVHPYNIKSQFARMLNTRIQSSRVSKSRKLFSAKNKILVYLAPKSYQIFLRNGKDNPEIYKEFDSSPKMLENFFESKKMLLKQLEKTFEKENFLKEFQSPVNFCVIYSQKIPKLISPHEFSFSNIFGDNDINLSEKIICESEIITEYLIEGNPENSFFIFSEENCLVVQNLGNYTENLIPKIFARNSESNYNSKKELVFQVKNILTNIIVFYYRESTLIVLIDEDLEIDVNDIGDFGEKLHVQKKGLKSHLEKLLS